MTGVGAPDDTWGVTCHPMPGTIDPTVYDPHHTQPWKRLARQPVRLKNPEDRTNLNTQCYLYDATTGDTAASVADSFLLDLREVVRNNTDVFPPVPVNVTFGNALTSAELAAILDVAQQSAMSLNAGALDLPYFVCPAWATFLWTRLGLS